MADYIVKAVVHLSTDYPSGRSLLWWCPLCKTGQIHPDIPNVGDGLACDVCDKTLPVVTWDRAFVESVIDTPPIGKTGLKMDITLRYVQVSKASLLWGD